MCNIYSFLKIKIMKNQFTLLLLLIVFGFGDLFAQNTISLGTYSGASSTNSLLSTSTTGNRYSKTLSIYTASEMIAAGGAAGVITSLAWDKHGTGEYTTNDAYIKVYLKHTNTAVWPTSPVPEWDDEIVGATEVFTSSTYSIPTGNGWVEVPFTNNFTWDGTSNVVVMVEWDRSSAPTGAISWGRSTDLNMNSTRVGSASLAALIMLVNSNRPLVQFTFDNDPPPPAVTAVTVSTENNVPAQITTDGGTLQMEAVVAPAAVSQDVTWSIVPGTGGATISTTGLITAQDDGTVWAKAVSDEDPNFMDSMEVTIINQLVVGTSLIVSTLNDQLPEITIYEGTLPLQAKILPSSANQEVNWEIINNTGEAAISYDGIVTALANGTVWAKATSTEFSNLSDSLEITITNQTVGVNQLVNGTDISVYPIPFEEELIIKFMTEDYVGTNIQLSNILGQVIHTQEIMEVQTSINTSKLSVGIYTLSFIQNGKTSSIQIMKK